MSVPVPIPRLNMPEKIDMAIVVAYGTIRMISDWNAKQNSVMAIPHKKQSTMTATKSYAEKRRSSMKTASPADVAGINNFGNRVK